jgi:hypothetical protein
MAAPASPSAGDCSAGRFVRNRNLGDQVGQGILDPTVRNVVPTIATMAYKRSGTWMAAGHRQRAHDVVVQ